MSFGILIFVGPGPLENKRLNRVFWGLEKYEVDVAKIVIVDDGSLVDYQSLRKNSVFKERLVVLQNPRKGKYNGWEGGLSCALLTGLKHFSEGEPLDFVLRLDTDALIIGNFASAVASKFKASVGCGLLGSFEKYPVHGGRRLPRSNAKDMDYVLKKLCRFFTVWRHDQWPLRIQTMAGTKNRLVRRIVRKAFRNGYRAGDFIQGGGYALSWALIQRSAQEGYLDKPKAFLRVFLGEDVVATLLCYALNFQAVDFNGHGEPFAVFNSGIYTTPTELHRLRYAIIHSVKNDDKFSEEAIFESIQSLDSM